VGVERDRDSEIGLFAIIQCKFITEADENTVISKE
jgi:hypothetical protein